jgi:hypothetical protein
MELSIPPDLQDLWAQLPPDDCERLLRAAHELFIEGLRFIQASLDRGVPAIPRRMARIDGLPSDPRGVS